MKRCFGFGVHCEQRKYVPASPPAQSRGASQAAGLLCGYHTRVPFTDNPVRCIANDVLSSRA